MNTAIEAWQEALFCVADLERWALFWTTVADWEVLHRGAVGRDWLNTWQLPQGATAEELLLGQPGQQAGHIRLIQLQGVEQQHMRSGGQIWETGGWFDINVRVREIEIVQRAVLNQGWVALADPVPMQMGPVRVKEWVARGPDGIAVAFIERLEPPLQGFPEFSTISRVFNATQIVRDEAASREWYENQLGFDVFIDTPGPGADGGPNVFGLPHNLIQNIPSHLLLLHPQGEPIGSIEFCSFATLSGRDFSAKTRMPNLGIVSLRFPVNDIAGLADKLRNTLTDEQWVAPLATRPFAPFGTRECFILRGPNGEWVEFFAA